MKIYEVKVVKVDTDGRRNGYRHIAYTINEGKAREVANAEAAAIANRNCWWMDTAATADGKPAVEVVELGEVVE